MEIIKALEWRHASKKMNGQPVPQEKIDTVLRAIQLAPTSMGLQPFTVLVITDPEIKKQIQPIAYGQTQIVDCSHLVVFAAWADITAEQVDTYIAHTAATRNMPEENLADFKKGLMATITRNSKEENFAWASRQTYIALGFAMAAAAVEQVDSTPMEGFKPAELDQLLGLAEKGLRSVTMLTLGYRDEENDWLAKLPKVRRNKEDLFIMN